MKKFALQLICVAALATPLYGDPAASQPTAVLCTAIAPLQAEVMEIAPKCVACTVGLVHSPEGADSASISSGSGVIISVDGLIMTAGHVIEKPGTAMTIRFCDGRVVKGVAVGLDHATDTGLVRITDPAPASGWPFASTAPDNSAAVGDWVLATGNPGSIVVDRNPPLRLGRVVGHDKNILQTNCALEPGDSGGPIFDLKGHVVGINSRIMTGNGPQARIREFLSIHVPVSLFSTEWRSLLAGMNAHPDAVIGQSGNGRRDRNGGNGALLRQALQKLTAEKDPEILELAANAQKAGQRMEMTPELREHLIKKAGLWPGSTTQPATQSTTRKSPAAPDNSTKDQFAPATRPSAALTPAPGIPADFRPPMFQGDHIAVKYGKTALQTLAPFAPALDAAGDCMVQIDAGDRQVLMGTIVSADGYIVTKASDLPAKPIVFLSDGRSSVAAVVGKDDATDLALLKISVDHLTPVNFSDNAPLGEWLVAPTANVNQPAIGLVSDVARPIHETFAHFIGEQKILLGISLTSATLMIGEIIPNMPAEIAGLKVGDKIVSLNGELIKDALDFHKRIGNSKTGDTLTIKVLRNKQEMEFKPLLGERKATTQNSNSVGEADNFAGGKLSLRRTNFPMAIQTDAMIWGDQCGGPLLDLKGKAVGITIARYDRVCTFALPADLVQKTIAKLKK